MTLPERHLGLVQASETQGLEEYLMRAAQMAEDTLDLDGLINAALPLKGPGNAALHLPPLGQRIAVADDTAFAFAYPHLLAHWREQGAEILTFSPLADEAPDENTDAIFLPGGYPELHAGHLAQAMNFKAGMRAAAARSATIYGECGGYMALGAGLVDAKGQTHEMLDLLPVSTSFQNRRLTLGYRNLTASSGPFKGDMLGHEFHYATITEVGEGPRLFTARDAEGNDLGAIGHVRNNVSGSFAHLIAPKGA